MGDAGELIRTYCPMSKSRCGVIATVEDGKFVRLEPDPSHPNHGICVKGQSAPQMVYDPLRLKYPMRRTRPKSDDDPGWQRVGWDEAMGEIAERLHALKAANGPESVFFYRGAAGGSSSQEYEAFMIRFASVFGSPNTVSTGHICNWHKDSGSLYTYGGGIPAPDFENSACILLWGHNPQASWPTQAMRISRAVNRGAKLIVIDPRPIPLTKKAALWLPVRPGSDGLLAMSFLYVMLEEKLYDEEFLRQWTNGGLLIAEAGGALRGEAFAAGAKPGQYVVWNEKTGQAALYDPESLSDGMAALTGRYRVRLGDGREVAAGPAFELLRERVQQYAPEKTAARTGIAPDLVRETVRLFTATKPNSYYTYNGIEQHADSMQINRAVCLFYALTGNLDRPGGNVRFPKPAVNDVEGRNLLSPEQFNKRLGYAERPLGPTNTGKVQAYEVYKAILIGKPYPVRGFLSFGGDIILSNGDTETGRRALQALDLYVQTEFYETPAARYADFLLPASTPWESWNLRTTFEQGAETSAYMQYRSQVIAPQHESRPDLEIIFDLAMRMGFGEQFWNGSIEKAFDYILAPSGVTLEDLKRQPGGMAVPLEVKYQKHLKNGFKTPSRKVEIYSLAFEKHGYDPLPVLRMPEEIFGTITVEHYPFTLTTAKTINFCHGQHRSVPSLRRKVPEPFAEINPRDGESCGIHDGEKMRVETEVSAITVKATFNPQLPEKVVRVMHGWWQGCPQLELPAYDPFSTAGANVNLIMKNDIIDAITGSVPHRSYPCRIARADERHAAASSG
ncbi:MAG: molybdopterin-dependent oxidoreductase [Deltaproteobacteria bacterium]|nr:molybdopterin-dependent oxidoreductase [Deltaproteobacteria bacterium]MDZ4343392.1 molybdopterin-dependent oxidoreductase [Candidatus Binatia bacterium]